MNPNTTEPHAKGEFGEPPAPTNTGRVRGPGYYVYKSLKAIASLQLTVVMFVIGMLLIFFGTMAQIDNGIWTVVEKYFWSWVVYIPVELFHKFLTVFWKEQFPAGESAWTGSFPFPGGILIGAVMVVNLLAAHAVRFRVSWKRIGVFMIHSGMLLMFAGEYITREYAVEQRMTIEQGKSTDFSESSRHVELAIIDKSDATTDGVVVIPENLLMKPRGRITHADLPVDVEVVGDFMPNSALEKVKPGTTNPADSGLGKMWVAKSKPEVSGLDEKQMNYPAVYVKLYKKGTDEVIGTYVGSLYAHLAGGDEELEIGGKKHEMMLRFKRYYKPYRVHLDQFRFDRYTGTEKAKNYSSDVRVFVPGNPDPIITQHIAMNEPLRYNGETFYQQSFDKTETTTTLQIVRNPGWVLPYVSCVVVGLGLAIHFLIYLILFLRRLNPPTRVVVTGFLGYLPWVILGVMALYLVSALLRSGPPKEPVDLEAFARMPVHEGGRLKPLDSVARVHLRLISGKEEAEDENGKTISAIRWYLEVLSGGNPQQRGPVWKYKFVRIDNEQVLIALGLQNRSGLRYSMEEIWPKIDVIQQRMVQMRKDAADNKKPSDTDKKFKEVSDRIGTFLELAAFNGPLMLPPRNPDEKWLMLQAFRNEARQEGSLVAMREAQARLFASGKLDNLTPEDEKSLIERVHGVDPEQQKLSPAQRAGMVAESVRLLKANPTAITDEARWDWVLAAVSLLPEDQRRAVADLFQKTVDAKLSTRPAEADWSKLVAAYRDQRAFLASAAKSTDPDERARLQNEAQTRKADFAAAVEDYRTVQTAAIPDRSEGASIFAKIVYAPFNVFGRIRTEVTYNRFAPFLQCIVLYLLAFILSVVGFTQTAAQRPQAGAALRRSATAILLLAFAVHMVALFARMYIMERPGVFVTNLYSSAIFIGLGCVGLCLVLERIFPMGVGNVLAAVLGLVTTIVAHNIASEDTLEMMVAVLDTNFWLATHVTTVTLGYTATFVAGFLGALYVFQMLGAVVRDSYLSVGEPTVGSLLAFGAAATGTVGIPLFFLWFMTSAMDKFELLPSGVLWTLYWITFAAGLMYAVGLMLLRVSSEGVDAHGKPLAGRIPGLAQPVAALALTPERGKVFGQMVYGVVCFATLLSFVGTVLGGIWADQSWGRFWGWDPKENGAVLIVLWNCLILHARWAGLVKDRGVAVLAIVGNVITAWSWFGTNQLSVGLHNYGFDSRLADGCFNFWLSQGFILTWGLIPRHFWASASRRAIPVAPPSGTAPLPTDASANGTPPANGQPPRDKGKRARRRR